MDTGLDKVSDDGFSPRAGDAIALCAYRDISCSLDAEIFLLHASFLDYNDPALRVEDNMDGVTLPYPGSTVAAVGGSG